MPRQLTLAFPQTPDYSPAALLPTHGSAQARNLLTANTQPVICLWGPEGCGKTHLLHAWATAQDAFLVQPALGQACPLPPYPQALAYDDIDALPDTEQRQLFHLFNAFAQTRMDDTVAPGSGHLVVASRRPVAELDLLPDLKSRLLLGLSVELQPPTAEELAQLAVKWAGERQLTLPDDVTAYLLSRAERSAPALWALICQLDDLSLEQRRAVTIPLARQVLSRSALAPTDPA